MIGSWVLLLISLALHRVKYIFKIALCKQMHVDTCTLMHTAAKSTKYIISIRPEITLIQLIHKHSLYVILSFYLVLVSNCNYSYFTPQNHIKYCSTGLHNNHRKTTTLIMTLTKCDVITHRSLVERCDIHFTKKCHHSTH